MSRGPLRAPSPTDVPVDRAELARRIIEPKDFVADTEAFVDVRLDRSRGKASYSFIGAGVSQNDHQAINLSIPHGFNVGAASMPHGVVNNQHLHYTAEVFVCTRGHWKMLIGEDGRQTLDISEGTVFSVPTWVFRGFENMGDDDGWLFAVLGGDDTGGIMWAPDVLRRAAETGLYLSSDNAVLDANAGDPIDDAIEPMPSDQLEVDCYSDSELAARAVRKDQLEWSDRALLSSALGAHATSIAPVIGHGMSQHRRHAAPITNPHGFSLEWLRIEPGSSTGRHRHTDSQVLLLVDGEWEIALNDEPDVISERPATGSVVSIPEGAWRDFVNVGTTAALAVVVCGSDAPTTLEWDPSIVDAAAASGYRLDISGFIAQLGADPTVGNGR